MIVEANELEASVAEWTRRGEAHPVFGMLRLATIDVWASRWGIGPFSERVRTALRTEVVRRVAVRIRTRLVR
jgi:hypothetical protein